MVEIPYGLFVKRKDSQLNFMMPGKHLWTSMMEVH